MACVWFVALAIESATRVMAGLIAHLGGDLPTPTLVTIEAAQNYAPWIVAVVSTLIILYLGLRDSAYLMYASTLVATVAAVLVSFVALSIVLPVTLCGVMWPEWPHQSTRATEKASSVVPQKAPPIASCR